MPSASPKLGMRKLPDTFITVQENGHPCLEIRTSMCSQLNKQPTFKSLSPITSLAYRRFSSLARYLIVCEMQHPGFS